MKILTIFLAFIYMSIFSTKENFAQTPPEVSLLISTTVPSTPLNVCMGEAEFEITVTNPDPDPNSDVNSPANTMALQLTLHDGLAYVSNSATINGSEVSLGGIDESVLTSPKFTINGVINFGESFTLRYKVKAGCGIIPDRTAGQQVTAIGVENTLLLTYAVDNVSYQKSHVTNSYNILYADLSIPITSADQTRTGILGDIITREIPVKNSSGAGSINEFILRVRHSSALHLENFYIINPNYTLSYQTVSIGGQLWYEIKINGPFEQGELLTIFEEVRVIACEPVSATDYVVVWGCDIAVCNDDAGSKANATSTVYINQPIGNPDLKYEFDFDRYLSKVSYCVISGEEPGRVNFVFKNHGENRQDVSANLRLAITNSPNGVNILNAFIVKPAQDGIPEERISIFQFFGPVGPEGTTRYFQFNFQDDIDGEGGLADIDGDGIFDDIASNESIQIMIEYNLSCPEEFNQVDEDGKGIYLRNFLWTYFEYTDICSAITRSTERQGFALDDIQYIFPLPPVVTGPTDMVTDKAEQFSFTVYVDKYGFLPACSTNNYVVNIQVPEGYLYDPADGPITWFDKQSGTTQSLTNIRTIPGNPMQIEITGGGPNSPYTIPLKLTCDNLNAVSGLSTLTWELFHICDDRCVDCRQKLGRATLDVFNHFRCGGSGGTECSISTNSFDADRATFGWKLPVGGTYHTPNSLAQADRYLNVDEARTAGLELHRVYEYDEIETQVVGETSNDCIFEDVHFEIKYNSPEAANILEFLPNASIELESDNETVIFSNIQLNALNSVGKTHYFDFKIPSTTVKGKVILKARFRIKRDNAIPFGTFELPSFRATVYANVNGIRIGNENWGQRITILKPYRYLSHVNEIGLDKSCDLNFALILMANGGISGDDFPHEFRSVIHLDKLAVAIPEGFTVIPGSSNFRFNFNNTQLHINDPVQTGNVLTWTIEEDVWPLLDKDRAFATQDFIFKLMPQCNSISPYSINFNLNYHDYDYFNQCPILSGESNEYCYKSAEFISHNLNLLKPELILSAESNQPGFERTSTWKIKLENLGTGGAENVWLALEPVVANTATIIFDNAYLVNQDGSILQQLDRSTKDNGKIFFFNFPDPRTLSPRETWQFEVVASYTHCQPGDIDQINLYSSWDCGGYPNLPSESVCTPLTALLTLSHKTANMQWTLDLADPLADFDLCEPVVYKAEINSTGLAKMYNVEFEIATPVLLDAQGVAKSVVTIQSIEYTYPEGVTNQLSLPLPILIPPTPSTPGRNIYTLNLSNEITGLGAGFTGDAFTGIKNPILLNITLVTTCGYGAEFTEFITRGMTNCKETIELFHHNKRVPLKGFTPIDDLSIAVAAVNDPIFEGGSTAITVTVTNNSNITIGDGATASTKRILKIELPSQIRYIDGTASPTNAITLPPDENGNYVLQWEEGIIGMITNESKAFTFSVEHLAGQQPQIQEFTITATTTMERPMTCNSSSPPEICPVIIPTDSIEHIIHVINKPPIPQNPFTCEDCIQSFAPEPGHKYVLSAWVKEEGNLNSTYRNGNIKLEFEGSKVVFTFIPNPKNQIIDGWQKIEEEFTIPADAIMIQINLNNTTPANSPSYDVFFDDIRIHPFNANMKSFVYDPISLRLMSELDENNYATYYEYDEEGALIRVKKETHKGVVTIKESRNNTQKINK